MKSPSERLPHEQKGVTKRVPQWTHKSPRRAPSTPGFHSRSIGERRVGACDFESVPDLVGALDCRYLYNMHILPDGIQPIPNAVR